MSGIKSLRLLPVSARRLIGINMINAAGTGLVVPLLVVYLHEMRGFSLGAATGAVAVTSLGALGGGPLAGWISDRFGRLQAVWASLVCAALGALGFAICDTPETALAAGLVQGLGIGGAITWNALMADLVPREHWSVVFAADFAVVNAMMGLGGLIGGLVAGLTDSLRVFQLLYILDAFSFLVTGYLVSRELRRGGAVLAKQAPAEERPEDPAGRPGRAKGSYRDVLRNRWLVALLLVVFALFTLGYSQLNSGMPAVLLSSSRLGPTELGVMFAVNTAAVVAVQFLFLNRIKDLTPRTALSLLAASWAVFWLLVLAVTGLGGGVYALLTGAFAMAVFALGESLLAATGPTLVNNWANDSNRGRFNAAYGFVCSLGFTAGPLLSGQLADGGHAVPMAAGFGLALGLLGLVLHRAGLLPSVPLSRLEEESRPAAETTEP
ncbi:MFS transporter [Streptomyces sp. TP-A0874]|uniref:MFS transporter n=1 Tax=Streptomyces sp. TP-A0874 TaxID=549819 RepID=UPI0008528E56|nr:MFS transporter [Streptomyces sp. TP-A0874]